jgi:hypothetical protein
MKVGGNMYALTQSADEQVRLRACQWCTARRMGWKETTAQQVTGADNGPVRLIQADHGCSDGLVCDGGS